MQTIFEVGVTANSIKAKVMLEKRVKHQRIIIKQKGLDAEAPKAPSFDDLKPRQAVDEADEDELQNAFSTVIAQKKRASQKPFDANKAKKKRVGVQSTKDEANYINYASKDHLTETGCVALGLLQSARLISLILI